MNISLVCSYTQVCIYPQVQIWVLNLYKLKIYILIQAQFISIEVKFLPLIQSSYFRTSNIILILFKFLKYNKILSVIQLPMKKLPLLVIFMIQILYNSVFFLALKSFMKQKKKKKEKRKKTIINAKPLALSIGCKFKTK